MDPEEELLEQRINAILERHHRVDNDLKQEGRKWRRILCPATAALFAVVAWAHFAQSNAGMGALFVGAALAFVAMLIVGEIIDRPSC
jgi:hypothetical protein